MFREPILKNLRFPRWLLHVVCIAIAFASVAADGYDALQQHMGFDYGLIIDAGSTGTRMHVFRWAKRIYTLQQEGAILGSHQSTPVALARFSIKPGLSSYSDEPDRAGDSIKPLLEFGMDTLKSYDAEMNYSKVPIFFSATAGLRTLPEKFLHPIMNSVRARISTYPFDSQGERRVRVISGEEEGAFGWLAVNSHFGNISSYFENTFGVLDCGGASAQISFIPARRSIKASLFPMHFGAYLNGPIHLYTHSFLRYGYATAWMEATRILLNVKLDPKHYNPDAEHPCLARGVEWHVNHDDFGVSIYEKKAERKTGPIHLIGTGDFAECRRLAATILYKGTRCTYDHECSFLGQYQPFLDSNRFKLVGNFGKSLNSIGVPHGLTLREASTHIDDFCALSDKKQKEIADRNGYKGQKAELLCWVATWSYALITEGFGFPKDAPNMLSWNAAEWGKADWTVGQMTYEVNFFPWYIYSEAKAIKKHHPKIAHESLAVPSALKDYMGDSSMFRSPPVLVQHLLTFAFGGLVSCSLLRCTPRQPVASAPLESAYIPF